MLKFWKVAKFRVVVIHVFDPYLIEFRKQPRATVVIAGDNGLSGAIFHQNWDCVKCGILG